MKTKIIISTFFLVITCTNYALAQDPARVPTEIIINRDGVLLKGKFHSAEGAGLLPTVLLLHPFPGSETDVLGIGKVLSESGINALTFNYSGTFKSEGETSLPNSIEDISAALDFLHNPENINSFHIDTSYIILGGHSYGGGMAMTYAIRHPGIKSVFTVAGVDWGEYHEEYIRNPEFRRITDGNMEKMAARTDIVRFAPGAFPKDIAAAGLDKLDSAFFLRKSANDLMNKDILIICGWDDPQATVEFILPIYRELKKAKAENVQILAFQDGHFFNKTRQELADAIKKWVLSVPERRK